MAFPTTVIANKEGVGVIHPAKLEPKNIDEVKRNARVRPVGLDFKARLGTLPP